MSAAELKEVFDARSVHRVAMVDDVFDAPTPDRLDRNAFTAFRTAYNGDPKLRGAIRRVGGKAAERLNQFEDVDGDDLNPIWRAFWRSRLGGRRLSAVHAATVRTLFAEHRDNVLEMLDLVVDLLSLFKEGLGRVITVHGTDYDPDEVAKADIVLVDFFLGQDITKEQALELSTEVVTRIVGSARRVDRSPPSFLLVSSRPEEIEIEVFRKRAELMKSRFRFFPKRALTADSIDELVSLHDLVDASSRAGTVEGLLDNWRDGARLAVDAVHERMLELDVADLVYLDCFRLTHEGVTIANYLRWFLTASLHARVTSKLDKKVWRKAEGLRLFNVLDEAGQLDPATLMKTFDGPSDVIAHAYGDILFDESRGAGDDGFPSPPPMVDLVEGDLFVKPKGRDRKSYDGAEVRLVMTPSCDLLPRAKGAPPAAKSVLLVPGQMRLMADQNMDDDVVKIDFIRVRERGQWRTFHLTWDHKNPISIEWGAVSASGVGKGFRRLGRLRELYFHKIREEFANQFTRIGTEVPPLFPRPRSGRILIAVIEGGKKRFEKVLDFTASDGLVWEVGPVKLRRPDGKSDPAHLYQGSRKLPQRLTSALGQVPQEPAAVRAAADHSAALLKGMSTYMDLMRPMKAGIRGADGCVDFKKAVVRSAAPATRSNSDIVIVTFQDPEERQA